MTIKTVRTPAVAAFGLLASACGTPYAAQENYLHVESPECDTADQCEIMWGAALTWVQQNCGFRIENITDNFIQTHKSGDFSDIKLGYEVTKTPLGQGRYKFAPRFWVNNWMSASHAKQQEARFKIDIARAGGITLTPSARHDPQGKAQEAIAKEMERRKTNVELLPPH